MSSTTREFSRANRTIPVGVTNWGISPITYVAATHNPPQPMRVGSQDALHCPSLDHAGNRRPYWALKE